MFANTVTFFKGGIISIAGAVASTLPKETYYLATNPTQYDNALSLEILKSRFDGLTQEQKNNAYLIRWEMDKMHDPRITGATWGEDHFWDDATKAARALHRVGTFGQQGLMALVYNSRIWGGHAAGHSIYYSLEENLNNEPEKGWIGYVNGMGTALEQAGSDVAKLFSHLAPGKNIHAVYLPTRQNAPTGDTPGFMLDLGRHLAVDGGIITRASCLIVQQWIDFLDGNNKYFLQTCHSEGASHVNGALRILREARPDLLARLRILSFAPAHFITSIEGENLQVINLVKKEDSIINPWGTFANAIGTKPHVIVVPHTQNHPHDPTSQDFVNAARPYVDKFLQSGNILSIELNDSLVSTSRRPM